MKLFHAATSVCSQKARIAFAEKGIEWESNLIDLSKGEQFALEYLELNSEAVVPTLVHDGFILRESSVIIDYIDQMEPSKPLMPSNINDAAVTRLWLIRTIEIHAAINTMTFATVFREKELTLNWSPDEFDAWLAKIPNPQIAQKRRDLIENGVKSVFVKGALHTLSFVLKDMNYALAKSKWLVGDSYSLVDIALIAYIDRLERLGMAGLWKKKFPNVSIWLQASQDRPSYASEILAYITPEIAAKTRSAGEASWTDIEKLIN